MGGAPPFTGVAVKVTVEPGQIVVCEAAILTAGVNSGLTETDIVLLVAFTGVAHGALLAMIQVTWSPLARALLLKVVLLLPTLVPFNCHW